MFDANFEYLISERTKLFTAVLLPNRGGKFPTVAIRSPYVGGYENVQEENIAEVEAKAKMT